MVPQLHVREVAEVVQAHAARGVTLLDVREPWELEAAPLAVPGAELAAIPMNELPARLAELDPSRLILGLCHHGVRSRQCVAFLLQQGYPHTYNIAGGIDAWSRDVDPLVPRY